jgi:hypothetical protein
LEQALLPHLERRDNVADPPGAALGAAVAQWEGPVRECLFDAGYVKHGVPGRGHGPTGLPCHGLMSCEYSEREARPLTGSDHWWGSDEPMGAAKGQRT